jgi:hypothetical protein
MEKLAREQAVILTGFTGINMCNFSEFHADVEKRLARPVLTWEFGDPKFADEVKELYREDFMSIMPEADNG